MQLTRRHVLAMTALTTGAAAATAGVVGARWWDRPAGAGFRHLSAAEGVFLRAFAGATYPATVAIPHDGGDLALDHYLDDALQTMVGTQRSLVKVLLHALDTWPMPRRRHAFADLDRPQQQQVVDHWTTHFRSEVRQAATSLVLLVGMGYTTHPRVAPFFASLHTCGYGR
ncbi:MAG: hypothetical protein VX265_07440 [Myxococcota bacterium]|nr:hypothetical protein [Myxococcota bacterium]MEC8425670.1 hypothetical protein [Myxococcota bacterium]